MEFNDLLRESCKSGNYIWETMQLNGGMGNIKRNPGEKKKRELCQELTGREIRFPLSFQQDRIQHCLFDHWYPMYSGSKCKKKQSGNLTQQHNVSCI